MKQFVANHIDYINFEKRNKNILEGILTLLSDVAFTRISCEIFRTPRLDLSRYNATCRKNSWSHYSRGEVRQNKEIEEIPRWRGSRDLRVVRHCPLVAERGGWRGSRPGIEFNAHCYQRREDATQPHCLAGLVTAGDIINRLRASHSPRLPPDFVASRWKLTGGDIENGGEGWKYWILYRKTSPFPGYAGFGYRRLSSSRKMEFLRCTIAGVRSPLHLSKEWICTRSRSICRKNNGRKNKILPTALNVVSIQWNISSAKRYQFCHKYIS